MTAASYFLPRPDAGSSAMDFNYLNRLGYTARNSNGQDPAAQKEIAKQFEALFLQQILKQESYHKQQQLVLDEERQYRTCVKQQ